MGMKSRASALVVAMVGAGVMSQATASVVGQTSTQAEFSYQLIDLDVNDGITPSISINPTSQLGLVYFTASNEVIEMIPGGVFSASTAVHASPDGLLQAAFSPTAQSTSAAVSTDMFETNSELFIGSAIAHFYGSDTSMGVPLPLEGEYSFELSANTALVIQVNTVMNASMDTSSLMGTPYQQSLVESGAAVGILLRSESVINISTSDDYVGPPEDWIYPSNTFVSSSIYLDAIFDGLGENTVEGRNQNEVLYATYFNDTASSVNVNFNYFVNSHVTTINYPGSGTDGPPIDPEIPPITPAIPEPSTAALMLLGLGGLAAAVRRQQLNRLKALTND